MADSRLKEAIKEATRKAYIDLIKHLKGEQIYYFVLTTVGEVPSPGHSVWTENLLEKEAQRQFKNSGENFEDLKEDLRWSYADSPLFYFGEKYFKKVQQLFLERPEMSHTMSEEEWNMEYTYRVLEMTKALKELDEEGLFGLNEQRKNIMINLEINPCDESNVERAKKLNPEGGIVEEWLRIYEE